MLAEDGDVMDASSSPRIPGSSDKSESAPLGANRLVRHRGVLSLVPMEDAGINHSHRPCQLEGAVFTNGPVVEETGSRVSTNFPYLRNPQCVLICVSLGPRTM